MIEIEKPHRAYKLFRKRKSDGAVTSLFIDKSRPLRSGEWMKAEPHLTKGFAFRPGWHCALEPVAPHLGMKDREWWEVEVCNWKEYHRPASQGGVWLLSEWIRLVKPCKTKTKIKKVAKSALG